MSDLEIVALMLVWAGVCAVAVWYAGDDELDRQAYERKARRK